MGNCLGGGDDSGGDDRVRLVPDIGSWPSSYVVDSVTVFGEPRHVVDLEAMGGRVYRCIEIKIGKRTRFITLFMSRGCLKVAVIARERAQLREMYVHSDHAGSVHEPSIRIMSASGEGLRLAVVTKMTSRDDGEGHRIIRVKVHNQKY